jgi:YVTN family beta-propeller protein
MNVFPRAFGGLAAVLMTLALAAPLGAATSNGLMDISADGRLLVCSNRDSGTVSVVDLQALEKLREIPVGEKPEGVTFLGDSHRLAVAVYGEDRITFLDADDGKTLGSLDVFDEPYGLVSTPDGTRVYATLEYPGQVIEIAPESRTIVRTIDAGKFLRGIALDDQNQRLYVTEYLTATVKAIDLASGEMVDEVPGLSTDNLARQVVLHPTRPKAYVPHIRSKVSEAHGNGSIFPYVSVIDTRPDAERRRGRVPMDSFRGVLVTANPWSRPRSRSSTCWAKRASCARN